MIPELEKWKHIGVWKDGQLVCRPDCPSEAHKNNTKEWEEEFDKEFPDGLYGAEWNFDSTFSCCWSETSHIKLYINTHFIPRSEIRRVVEGMKEPMPSINSNYYEPRMIRNKVLSDLLDRLELNEKHEIV